LTRLTLRALHSRCQKLLQRTDTTLEEVTLSQERAKVTWDKSPTANLQIKVDTDQDGRIQLVLHELVHVAADDALIIVDRVDDELEEAFVESWAKLLWEYVDENSRRRKWWRDQITQKL